jgi:hypothetical protein
VEFINSLRDFARSSEFMRFFDGHKPFYNSVVRRSQQQAAMTRGYWEAYTGMPLPDRKLILSSLAGANDLSKCASGGRTLAPPTVLSLGTLAQTNEAQTFLSTEGTQVGLYNSRAGKPPKPKAAEPAFKMDAAQEEQVIRAVFARIAALSKGDAAGRLAVEQEVRGGFAMVAGFDERLRFYEAHRDQFVTLADYLPQLIANSGKIPAKSGAADADSKAASARCGFQIAATTPESPVGSSTGQ